MCIHVPPNLFQETRMPNFEETSDLAKQVRKMSIRNAINLLADVLQERQEMERGEPGPQGVSGKDSTVPGPEGKSGRDSAVPGPQGVPGENGRDATISIGTVTSGPASVTVRVENGAHVLDFVLPQGKTGASGETVVGPKGEPGAPGKDGVTLAEVAKSIDDILAILSRVSEVRQLLGESGADVVQQLRSEEHTSELQSRLHLVCRLLLEKKKMPKSESNIRPSSC